MYVHGVQKQQAKGVRGFPGGQTGLDNPCYGDRFGVLRRTRKNGRIFPKWNGERAPRGGMN